MIGYIIISFILSSIIVNIISNVFMKIIGARGMFYDGNKRFMLILVVTWFIFNVLMGN